MLSLVIPAQAGMTSKKPTVQTLPELTFTPRSGPDCAMAVRAAFFDAATCTRCA